MKKSKVYVVLVQSIDAYEHIDSIWHDPAKAKRRADTIDRKNAEKPAQDRRWSEIIAYEVK